MRFEQNTQMRKSLGHVDRPSITRCLLHPRPCSRPALAASSPRKVPHQFYVCVAARARAPRASFRRIVFRAGPSLAAQGLPIKQRPGPMHRIRMCVCINTCTATARIHAYSGGDLHPWRCFQNQYCSDDIVRLRGGIRLTSARPCSQNIHGTIETVASLHRCCAEMARCLSMKAIWVGKSIAPGGRQNCRVKCYTVEGQSPTTQLRKHTHVGKLFYRRSGRVALVGSFVARGSNNI